MKLFKRISILLLLIFLIYLIFRFWPFGNLFSAPVPSFFKVDAVTEYFQYTHADKDDNRFSIDDAVILYDDKVEKFGGSIRIKEGTEVSFKRLGKGELIITLRGVKQSDTLAYCYSGKSSEITVLTEYATISISPKSILDSYQQRLLIPVRGLGKIGNTINSVIYKNNVGILKSGDVTVSIQTSKHNTFDEISSHSLQLGDEIVFIKCPDEAMELSYQKLYEAYNNGFGLLAVNEDDGMNLSYRIRALESVIIKPGPRDELNPGYIISSSYFDNIYNNRTVRKTVLILSGIFAFVEFLHLIKSFFKSDGSKSIHTDA